MLPLAQQVSIISGGLGDIGRAIVLELSTLGADVALGDVPEPGERPAILQTPAKGSRERRGSRLCGRRSFALVDNFEP